MSNDVSKRKLSEITDEADTVKKTKVQESAATPKLEINPKLKDVELLKELKSKWGKGFFETEDKGIKLNEEPFSHAEVEEILVDPSILKSLQGSIKYVEKTSDLFHFHQSCDLSSVNEDFEGYDAIKQICNFFTTDLFDVLKNITGLPLNGKYDIFASEYKRTDHLLCHDDELDSRRIAFMIYMSEEWKEDYGGSLDLFDSIENDNGPAPGLIKKSIVPKFNKLVFFEVTAKSFHQVSEVVHESACRWAISGWFYGDPLPRPEVIIPSDVFFSVDFPDCKEVKLEGYLDDSYLDQETIKTANDQLSENSEILLSSFLKPEVYGSLLQKLEALEKSEWEHCGPANLRNYDQLPESSSGFPTELKAFFTSKNFLEFLQELTEFPFASEPNLRFTYSLKKFQRGAYTLVRGKERNYKPRNFVPVESGDDNSDDEALDDDEEEHADACGDENVSPVNDNPASSSAGNGIHESDDEEEMVPDSPEGYEIVDDEEPEEPNRVDIVFFLIPPAKNEQNGAVTNGSSEADAAEERKWDEAWGGNRIYTDDLTGNQLINVLPSGNALAVVVRDESISSHYSYVNSLAGNRLFYCYDFEFDFPRGK